MQAKLELLNVKKSSLKSKNSQYYFYIFNFKGRSNLIYSTSPKPVFMCLLRICFNTHCRMYQDKLAQLKKQLQQLKDGTLPEYMKKLRKIDQSYRERLRINEIWYQYEVNLKFKSYIVYNSCLCTDDKPR